MVEPARPGSAVARFRDGTGAVVGAGFLVGGGLVVTCAHVVAAALHRDERERPDGQVTVEFPIRGWAGPARCTATVVGWTPTRPDDRGDIAVLRLDGEVPDGVRPAQFDLGPAPDGAVIEALGFPDDLPEQGGWARGWIRKEQATGWLQIDSVPGSPRIRPGYSGTPVFSASSGGVIGMVVAVVHDAEHTIAFLNPARTLVAEHSMLYDAQESPYRGLAAFAEGDADVFRGRDALIDDAFRKAEIHPLLVLSGPSGSGKSSLARAGLVPRLRARGRSITTVRVEPDEPAAALLARIVARLTERADPDEAAAIEAGQDPGRIAEGLRVDVMLVDQFEEADPDTARAVAGYLYRLATAAGLRADGAPRLLVVLTLRGRQLDAVATGETAAAMQAGLVLVAPMTTGQLREAVAPPGTTFEPGLVERLVADAGTEPGTLPLLGFTLDRLWERRELGVLTHAGYEELGGVDGAVARYADRAYERDPARARRLLVLLARPDGDGVFRRRPLPLADLPAGLRPALDRLVASRLVVVGPGAAGEGVAELAHEALIRAWPRLRDWLEQDRDFRTWQEEARRAARHWQQADRDPDALVRGVALATAVRWAEARGAELGADEAEFVRASVARDRRRARRGRSVTAALVVLTLLAGAFALTAQQRSGDLREKVRTAASRQLADDAERFRRSRPDMSLQLALAAWHAGQTSEAYGALLTQYATLDPVDRILTDLTATPGSPIEAVSTSRDGSVAVVTDNRGGGEVWRGLAEGDPHRVTFAPGPRKVVGGSYRVSPSGRYRAYANNLGGVTVRDVAHPELPPVELAPSGPDRAGGTEIVRSVRFAPDDTGLAVLRSDLGEKQAELRVWDLRTRQAVPGLPRLDRGFVPSAVFFGPVPGSIVLSAYDVVASYDLASRRNLRIFRQVDGDRPVVAGGGSLVVTCVGGGKDDKVVVRDIGTGRQLRSIAVPTCSGFEMDANSEFGTLATGGRPGETNVSLRVLDPQTGRMYQATTPPAETITGFTPIDVLAVHRGGDGVPAVLLGDADRLYRIRLGPALTPAGANADFSNRDSVATPDGAHRVLIDRSSGRITLVETGTDRQVATVPATPLPHSFAFHGVPYAVSDDSGRLLTAHHEELTVYRLPGLTVEHRLRLPVPPGLGLSPVTDTVADDWAGSVVTVGASEAIVLYAGVLTRWNVVTGVRIGAPVELREGQDQGSRRRAAQLAFATGRRPKHPDQVAVVLSDTVQVWSLDQRRAVASFEADPAQSQNASMFHPDGSLLAMLETNGSTSVWPVDDPHRTPWTVPTGIGVEPLGFTPGKDSHLVTIETGSVNGLAVWELDPAKRVALITAPIGSEFTMTRDEIGMFTDGYVRRLRLNPALWFTRLCAMAARPYTAEETKLLGQRGAPVSRPCP